ncbi:CDP-alcohol phosphatidyltransferase [Tersicoccus solisilvae]|uniref:CDP-alcohol phosphatidyltransferase n=1 Tax=Tersicoccus solisilvae TaxID=1882339 RepID=A0ABQ1PNS3_9MICC|nr:CDP-alcohol phosphatidyltransferase family protein [Tersicoccus solisilvae]GGD00120.1 CDP-alcohol phosphatidyltransferase [Tersicoccus solisilvae]
MTQRSTLPRTLGMHEAYRALADAQKGRARSSPAYSILVNRPLGRLLAVLAYRWGLTPNQVSLISIGFSVAGMLCLVLVPPSVGSALGAAACLVLGYAWDSADGQLARLLRAGSPQGEWLDHVLDSFKNVALHLVVLVAAFRWWWPDAGAWLVVPLVFAVSATVSFAAMLLNDLLSRGTPRPSRAGGTSVFTWLALPTDYGLLCCAFVLWAFPPVFMVVYGLLALCSAGFCALATVKWFRDMGRVGTAA